MRLILFIFVLKYNCNITGINFVRLMKGCQYSNSFEIIILRSTVLNRVEILLF